MPFDQTATTRSAGLRTLFLSDLHLGAIGSRPDLILDFLRAHPARHYVLAGDVLDLWQPLLPHWTPQDQAVIDHLNRRVQQGARLDYIRGNHDPDPARVPAHARLAARLHECLVHRAADGRCYLVLHGDEVDSRLVRSHGATRIGSLADHLLRRMDLSLRRIERSARGETRSLVEGALASVNRLSYRRRRHEGRLVALARAAGLDGVICGHFHIAGLHDDHGLIYANCGDWVDSHTALAETWDGALRLFDARGATGEARSRPAAWPVDA